MKQEDINKIADEAKVICDLDVVLFLKMIKAKAEKWVKDMKNG